MFEVYQRHGPFLPANEKWKNEVLSSQREEALQVEELKGTHIDPDYAAEQNKRETRIILTK